MKYEANEAANRLLKLQVKALVASEGVIMCLIDENSSLEKQLVKERTKYDKVFASGSVFDSYKQSFEKIENLLGNRKISPEEIYVEVKNLLERRKIAEGTTINDIVSACAEVNHLPVGITGNLNKISAKLNWCMLDLQSQDGNIIDVKLIGLDAVKESLSYSIARLMFTLAEVSYLAEINLEGEINKILKQPKEA